MASASGGQSRPGSLYRAPWTLGLWTFDLPCLGLGARVQTGIIAPSSGGQKAAGNPRWSRRRFGGMALAEPWSRRLSIERNALRPRRFPRNLHVLRPRSRRARLPLDLRELRRATQRGGERAVPADVRPSRERAVPSRNSRLSVGGRLRRGRSAGNSRLAGARSPGRAAGPTAFQTRYQGASEQRQPRAHAGSSLDQPDEDDEGEHGEAGAEHGCGEPRPRDHREGEARPAERARRARTGAWPGTTPPRGHAASR